MIIKNKFMNDKIWVILGTVLFVLCPSQSTQPRALHRENGSVYIHGEGRNEQTKQGRDEQIKPTSWQKTVQPSTSQPVTNTMEHGDTCSQSLMDEEIKT